MNNVETEYRNLKNRCPNCGHRLEMTGRSENVCSVEMGIPPTGKEVIHCPCRKHQR